MTAADDTYLDGLARVFAVIDIAVEYGFAFGAAAHAARTRLDDLDREQLLTAATLLAGLIATELRPAGPEDLERWSGAYGFTLACKERPA